MLGGGLGLLYEFIRLFRFAFGGGNRGKIRMAVSHVVTFIGDAFFIIIFAIAAILQTFKISGGVFRGLTYIGMSVGFMTYYLTIGRLMLKPCKKMAAFIKKAARLILKVIFTPLRLLFLLVFKIYVLTIGKILGKIIYRIKEKNSADRVAQENEISGDKADCELKGYKKEGRISFGGKGIS